MAAGCRAVLAKPYTSADLCGVLVSLLRGDRAVHRIAPPAPEETAP
jgi:hypothetical protein